MGYVSHTVARVMQTLTVGAADNTLTKKRLKDAIGNVCIMSRAGMGHCASSQLIDGSDSEWVECQRCHAWYHCICVGISSNFFDGDRVFICCYNLHTDVEINEQSLAHYNELASSVYV